MDPTKRITDSDWELLVDGCKGKNLRVEASLEKWPNPDKDGNVIKEEAWKFVLGAEKGYEQFEGLSESISGNFVEWAKWMKGKNPHLKRLPVGVLEVVGGGGEEKVVDQEEEEGTTVEKNWEKSLTQFQKIILVKYLCPEYGVNAVRKFVTDNLGKNYAVEKGTEGGMESLYADMDAFTPCLFVLSPGSDPMSSWSKLAKKVGAYDMAKTISLGQGQGPRATAMIETAKRIGVWVLLQNCHLAKSWMLELEKIVNLLVEQKDDVSKGFRLFLTSMPVSYFPVSVLQTCIKQTTEPPSGIRSNMLRALELHISPSMLSPDYLTAKAAKANAKGAAVNGAAVNGAAVGSGLGTEWKNLLYSICMFHAVTTERRKFGSIGFNAVYDFSDNDLMTAVDILRRMLEDSLKVGSRSMVESRGNMGNGRNGGNGGNRVPLDSLRFVTGQIVYGGRVTDDWDRRCLMSLINSFYNKDLLPGADSKANANTNAKANANANANATKAGDSKAKAGSKTKVASKFSFVLDGREGTADIDPSRGLPDEGSDYDGWRKFILDLPGGDPTSLFGMHPNADVMCSRNETVMLFDNLQRVKHHWGAGGEKTICVAGAGAGGVASGVTTLRKLTATDTPGGAVAMAAKKMLREIPSDLHVGKAHGIHSNSQGGYGRVHKNALTVVLFQEVEKFNRLLGFCREGLENLLRAVVGEIAMSEELDKMYHSIDMKRVPDSWGTIGLGFPSLKGLGSWCIDLASRVEFFAEWLYNGKVKSYLLGAFFFPQGFLTGVLQNFARKHTVAINILDFAFDVVKEVQLDKVGWVDDGVLIHGLFMECCRWDAELESVGDERPGQVVCDCPIIHLLPDEDHVVENDVYVCPLYKTSKRQGTLSTSGISSNFVLAVELPTNIDVDVWILRGAALLCSLDT